MTALVLGLSIPVVAAIGARILWELAGLRRRVAALENGQRESALVELPPPFTPDPNVQDDGPWPRLLVVPDDLPCPDSLDDSWC